MVSAHESHQHLTAVRGLQAYGDLLPRTRGQLRRRLLRDLESLEALLDQMPPSPMLEDARSDLRERVADLDSGTR
jgi:hypothetical protein